MTDMNRETEAVIEKYNGIPNEGGKNEKTKWEKFLNKIIPWFVKKRELGERFLIAKVLKEEAEAINILADAKMKVEQAKKISVETRLLEQEKLKKINLSKISDDDINARISELEDRLRYLSNVKGLRIDIDRHQDKIL